MADQVLHNHPDQDGRIVNEVPLGVEDHGQITPSPSDSHVTADVTPPPALTGINAAGVQSIKSKNISHINSGLAPIPLRNFQLNSKDNYSANDLIDRGDIPASGFVGEHRTTAPTVFITSSTATAETSILPLITLGPIIGLVTDTTARVLIECNRDITVTARLTILQQNVRQINSQMSSPVPDISNSTNTNNTLAEKKSLRSQPLIQESAPSSHPSCLADPDLASYPSSDIQVSVACKRHRVQLIKFASLLPNTRYKLSFTNIPERVPSSITTLLSDWSINDLSPEFRLGLVSCNLFSITKALKQEDTDLWLDLQRRASNYELDYIFHIGDQIYADEHRTLDENALEEKYQLVFKVGVNMLKELGEDEKGKKDWPAAGEHIKELYRQLYRESWSHPPTAATLANVPNLMILDDHDFRDDWGNEPEDSDPSSAEYFVGRCAHLIMCEYQRSLWDDVDFNAINEIKKDFHFHVFGEHGVIFMDVRGPRSLHRVRNDPTPYIGIPQWKEITDACTKGGIFDNVKSLLVICPAPLVFLPTHLNDLLGNTMLDDALGHWSSKPFQPEQMRMLNLLKNWKYSPEGGGQRELTLIGGDVHVGGQSEIKYNNQVVFQQIITSAIANHQLSRLEFFVGTLTQESVNTLTRDNT